MIFPANLLGSIEFKSFCSTFDFPPLLEGKFQRFVSTDLVPLTSDVNVGKNPSKYRYIYLINIHKPVRELGVIFCPQLPQLVEKTELENHQPQLILEGDLLLPVQWLLLHWRWLQARQGLKISAVF